MDLHDGIIYIFIVLNDFTSVTTGKKAETCSVLLIIIRCCLT